MNRYSFTKPGFTAGRGFRRRQPLLLRHAMVIDRHKSHSYETEVDIEWFPSSESRPSHPPRRAHHVWYLSARLEELDTSLQGSEDNESDGENNWVKVYSLSRSSTHIWHGGHRSLRPVCSVNGCGPRTPVGPLHPINVSEVGCYT